MLISGDIVDLDLGTPEGSEAGFRHPAIIVTGQSTLDLDPSVVQIVPITSIIRPWDTEVPISPDVHNGLDRASSAQCQHVRGVSASRLRQARGNVGPVILAQVRDRLADLLDIPG